MNWIWPLNNSYRVGDKLLLNTSNQEKDARISQSFCPYLDRISPK